MGERLAVEITKVFQPCVEADVTSSGNRWRVATYVDTEDVGGQPVRLDFVAILEYRPTTIPIWTLTCIGSCP
jgi:hypothetical protein